MKKDRVFQYARELNQLIKQANEISGQRDALTSNIQIAEKMKDLDRAQGFSKQRMEATNVFEAVAAVIQEKTNRSDVESGERLLQQISSRLENLGQLESQLYQLEAAMELNAATGQYEGEEGTAQRASHEKTLNDVRNNVETQLKLAEALIPNKAIVLTV